MTQNKETIKTKIWYEESEADNPYAAKACYCSGYDVYGDLLGKVSWVQYLYLLFRLELPGRQQARLLETVAVALANPGIRDLSVRAAMNAGVGGSTRASALMAALAVGAGNLGGGREVYLCVALWQSLGSDLEKWRQAIAEPAAEERIDVWLPMEHVPGFDPNGASCPAPVLQVLEALAEISPENGVLQWLRSQRIALESATGYPLAFSGVAAAAFHDLGFSPEQAEMLYLMLRLPGAAAHALEQEGNNWRQYPFFGSSLKPLSNDEYQDVLQSLENS
jgi:citrate synthase